MTCQRRNPSFLLVLALGLLVTLGESVSALDDGLARTPPMGWNSWNALRLDINEDLVKQVADVMVDKGLKDAGYEYLVIDDGWQIARDQEGHIVVDPTKFPSGIKALADIRPCWDCGKQTHSKGVLIENFIGFTKTLDQQVDLEPYAGPGTGTIPTCSRWATVG